MPEIVSDITGRSFRSLLLRMGAYINVPFQLVNYVLPVSIVDTDVSITSTSSPPIILTPASAGELDNPASNTRCANTGALPAGNYFFLVMMNCDASNMSFRLRRRAAGDAADIWSQRLNIAVSRPEQYSFSSRMETNELLVVENVNGPGAGLIVQCSIWPVLLS